LDKKPPVEPLTERDMYCDPQQLREKHKYLDGTMHPVVVYMPAHRARIAEELIMSLVTSAHGPIWEDVPEHLQSTYLENLGAEDSK
jgi:flavorubredoxin